MAEANSEKVAIEIDLPSDQVKIHELDSSESSTKASSETSNKEGQKTQEKLEEAREKLNKVSKERDELKQEIKESKEEENKPLSLREALAKEIDPNETGPIKETTGYDVGEIITAPLHPPEPEAKGGRPKLAQLRNIVIGFALMPLALVCWPIFGGAVAIIIALVGALFIAAGVLFRT